MTEPTAPVKKFQWKWVWISFGSYVVFYILPLIIFGHTFPHHPVVMFLFVTWIFVGIIVVTGQIGLRENILEGDSRNLRSQIHCFGRC